MTTYYLHTLDGAPAYFDPKLGALMFATSNGKAAPLATSLRQIRREQRIDQEHKGSTVTYGYTRVSVENRSGGNR